MRKSMFALMLASLVAVGLAGASACSNFGTSAYGNVPPNVGVGLGVGY